MADITVYDGKWELIETDDMTEFLDAVGTSPEIKAKALEMVNKMVKEVRHQGEKWQMRTVLSDRVIEYDYILGEMADKVALDGRPMRGRLYFDEDGVMVEEAQGDGYWVRHERRVEGDFLLQKIVGNGVTIYRKYKKIE